MKPIEIERIKIKELPTTTTRLHQRVVTQVSHGFSGTCSVAEEPSPRTERSSEARCGNEGRTPAHGESSRREPSARQWRRLSTAGHLRQVLLPSSNLSSSWPTHKPLSHSSEELCGNKGTPPANSESSHQELSSRQWRRLSTRPLATCCRCQCQHRTQPPQGPPTSHPRHLSCALHDLTLAQCRATLSTATR